MTQTPIEEMDFETAFAELEATVRQLEAGDLPLEKSLALFERGIALARACENLLDSADLRVRQLAPAANGYEAEPFSSGTSGVA
ncbi:MAG: exodeoxyribonuclease VII small subunit [Anaerolineae bacterium]|nr:exodeoxyribonuclease VII small subunit [Anaerolineae bacterium]